MPTLECKDSAESGLKYSLYSCLAARMFKVGSARGCLFAWHLPFQKAQLEELQQQMSHLADRCLESNTCTDSNLIVMVSNLLACLLLVIMPLLLVASCS